MCHILFILNVIQFCSFVMSYIQVILFELIFYLKCGMTPAHLEEVRVSHYLCLGFPKIPRQLLNSEHLSRMCISIHSFHPFPLRTFPTLSLYHFHSIRLVNHIHAFSCTHTTPHFVLFYLCCVFVVIKRCSPLLYHGCPWRLVRTFGLASPRLLQARASGCGV